MSETEENDPVRICRLDPDILSRDRAYRLLEARIPGTLLANFQLSSATCTRSKGRELLRLEFVARDGTCPPVFAAASRVDDRLEPLAMFDATADDAVAVGAGDLVRCVPDADPSRLLSFQGVEARPGVVWLGLNDPYGGWHGQWTVGDLIGAHHDYRAATAIAPDQIERAVLTVTAAGGFRDRGDLLPPEDADRLARARYDRDGRVAATQVLRPGTGDSALVDGFLEQLSDQFSGFDLPFDDRPAVEVRRSVLPFLPHLALFEITDRRGGLQRTGRFVHDSGGKRPIVELRAGSGELRKLAEDHSLRLTPDNAASWTRFFCGNLRAQDGLFALVEREGDLSWFGYSEWQSRRVSGLISPLRCWSTEGSQLLIVDGICAYGGALAHVVFQLGASEDGGHPHDIVMLEDTRLVDPLWARQMRYAPQNRFVLSPRAWAR